MSDPLLDRIERVIEDHTLINGADECTCGVMWEVQDGFRSTDGSTCFDNHLADAVIAELRPQLAAWARLCVDSGDMTPAALRALHRILGGNHD